MLATTRDNAEECERLLGIKVKVVNRVGKDLKSYEAEANKQLASIKALEAQNPEEDPDLDFKIKKSYQSYDETKRMIPECQQRLTAAKVDLEKFIEDFASVLGEERVRQVRQDVLQAS